LKLNKSVVNRHGVVDHVKSPREPIDWAPMCRTSNVIRQPFRETPLIGVASVASSTRAVLWHAWIPLPSHHRESHRVAPVGTALEWSGKELMEGCDCHRGKARIHTCRSKPVGTIDPGGRCH